MTKREFVGWLRERVPPGRWQQVWWLAPTITLFLLPVGTSILQVLARLGWYGAARTTQGLMLLSLISGPVVGSLVLWSVREADLEPHSLNRAQWLARLAVLGPGFNTSYHVLDITSYMSFLCDVTVNGSGLLAHQNDAAGAKAEALCDKLLEMKRMPFKTNLLTTRSTTG